MVAWGESMGHSHTGVTQQRDPDLEGAPVLGSPHGRADFLGDPGFLLLISICLLLGRKVMTNLDSILKSINSSALSLLSGLTRTSIHDYWKNHSFDYMDLYWQSDVSAF